MKRIKEDMWKLRGRQSKTRPKTITDSCSKQA